jgi:hypothetical protein
MRLFEIDDTSSILKILNRHFKITGKIDINNGIVNITGNCEIKNKIEIQKLPVQFGNVSGDFNCGRNQLTTLEGAPSSVGGSFYCSYSDNLPLLRLLLIKDVKEIYLVPINDIVEDILNKYIGQGRGGALACAAELTKAGFKNNARL